MVETLANGIKKYSATLLGFDEYPNKSASICYYVGGSKSINLNCLDIKVEYPLCRQSSIYERNYVFKMKDWYVSWDKDPTDPVIYIHLKKSKKSSTIYDQTFAIEFQDEFTEEFLQALQAGSKGG